MSLPAAQGAGGGSAPPVAPQAGAGDPNISNINLMEGSNPSSSSSGGGDDPGDRKGHKRHLSTQEERSANKKRSTSNLAEESVAATDSSQEGDVSSNSSTKIIKILTKHKDKISNMINALEGPIGVEEASKKGQKYISELMRHKELEGVQ